MKTMGYSAAFALALAAALFSSACSKKDRDRTEERREPPPAVEHREAMTDVELKEFSERVDNYVALRKKIEKGLPTLKDRADATTIAAHRQRLAEAIRTARANAQPGDIFSATVQPGIVAVVRSELKGPGSEPARATVKEGNPAIEGSPTRIQIAVNAPYPEGAPVSTMPPTLLLKLPPLPEDLGYSFIGRTLILRDAKAGIIVDFIPDAMP